MDECKFGFFTDMHYHHTNPRSRKGNYTQDLIDKLHQIGQIAKSHGWSFILFGGDMFHTIKQPFWALVQLIYTLQTLPPVFAITGNHDQKIGEEENTPLEVLFSCGALKRLDNQRSMLHRYHIAGLDFREEPTLDDLDNIYNDHPSIDHHILVAHQFIYTEEQKKQALRPEWFRGWDLVLLGHDHTTYPIEYPGNRCQVVRAGALSRGTKAEKDRLRKVQVVEVVIDGDDLTVNTIPLKVRPHTEVFSEEQIKRESLDRKIENYIKKLAERVLPSECPVIHVLQETCKDEEVRALCEHYLREEGVL